MNVDDVLSWQSMPARGCEADKEYIEVYTSLEDMEKIRKSLENSGIAVQSAELSKVAKKYHRTR